MKEQNAGLYAQTMAERGFVTIAHDPSYNGESGGQPLALSLTFLRHTSCQFDTLLCHLCPSMIQDGPDTLSEISITSRLTPRIGAGTLLAKVLLLTREPVLVRPPLA